MNRIAFYGVLGTGDAPLAAAVLGKWVKASLVPKVRIGGVEIDHEDERVSLYCHEASVKPGGPPELLLEGSMAGTLEEAKASLVELRDSFRARQVRADLEYVEVDDDGQEVGEQVSLDSNPR